MISIITDLWKRSPFSPICEHVYEHQKYFLQPLPMLAKLNSKMDIIAKKITMEHIVRTSAHQTAPTFLGTGTIMCREELITSQIQQSLYTCILHNKLVKWHLKTLDIPLNLLREQVAWRVFEKSRSEGRIELKTFMNKWISGNTATGKIMRMRKKSSHSNCPRCNSPDEQTTHVL